MELNFEYPDGVLTKDLSDAVTLFAMGKDSKIGDHTSTKKGFIYVIEGKGVFTLEGKDIEMKKGVYIEMDANAVHSLRASENTSFLLFLH